MNQLISINIHNESIDFIKDSFSECWVVVRRICENIDLHLETQIKRIKRDGRFNYTVKRTVAEDGKEREMFCLAYEDFWGWLFSINPRRVKKTTAEKLTKYYKLMKKSIHDIVMSRFSLTPEQQAYQIMEQRDRYMQQIETKEEYIKSLCCDLSEGQRNEKGNLKDNFVRCYLRELPKPKKTEDKNQPSLSGILESQPIRIEGVNNE